MENIEAESNSNLLNKSIELQINPSSDKTLLDEIINNYGYSSKTILKIIDAILLYVVSSYCVYHLSSFNNILKNYFKVSENTLTAYASIGFLSKLIGCLLSGYMVEFIQRKTIILISIIVIILLNILINIHLSLFTYITFILGGSLFSGFIDPINMDVLCENLPIKFRGFFLCFSYTGFIDFQYFLIWIFSKKNEVSLNKIFLINSIIFFLIGIFTYFVFEDSARHLIIKKEYERSFEILEKYNQKPLTESEKSLIKNKPSKEMKSFKM